MNNVNAQDIFADIESQCMYIDGKINDLLNSYTQYALKDLSNYVKDHIVTDSASGIWADMPIYLSSYTEYDKRFIMLLKNKLREYIGFYEKILNDEGVQRHLVYSKEYSNDGNGNTTERGINSNTPQNSDLYDSEHPESDSKFDQAIADFATTIDKNKADMSNHTEGTSDTVVGGTTWDEGKKNIQMIFYNELKDYIMSIPDRIYHYYSIGTIPAPELVKLYFKHFKEVREMLEDE